MMNIKALLMNVVDTLKADPFFDDIKLVRAYPYMTKPTMPEEAIIAISIGEVKLKPCHIGEDSLMIELSLWTDIYVPFSLGTELGCDIFSRLCECVGRISPKCISSSRMVADKESGCYLLQCEITFDRELEVGGERGE